MSAAFTPLRLASLRCCGEEEEKEEDRKMDDVLSRKRKTIQNKVITPFLFLQRSDSPVHSARLLDLIGRRIIFRLALSDTFVYVVDLDVDKSLGNWFISVYLFASALKDLQS